MATQRLAPEITTLASAFLLALSAPLWGFGFLVYVAFVPFLWNIKNRSVKENLIQSFWFQLVFSAGIFFWVPPSFIKLWPEGNSYFYMIFFVGLITLVEFQILLWAFVRHKVNNINWLLISIISALVYVGLDMVVMKFVKDTLAHALFQHYAIKQLVPIIGVYGLSFFIMIVNELIFVALKNKNRLILIIPCLLLFCGYMFGYYKLNQSNNSQEKDNLSITLIQPNLGHHTKVSIEEKKKIVLKLFDLTEQAISKFPETKIVLWPETVYPFDFISPTSFEEEEINQQLKQLILDKQIDLYFGGLIKIDGLLANAYIHVYPIEGEMRIEYELKQQLFPFGEEIPFTKIWPGIKDLFPLPTVSKKGTELNVHNLKNIKVGTLICYESITNKISNLLSDKQVDLILNPTNESSFTSFGEPQLALALTSFRALELGVPLIRVADTGLSAYVDSKGIILYQSKMDQEEIKNLIISIPKQKNHN